MTSIFQQLCKIMSGFKKKGEHAFSSTFVHLSTFCNVIEQTGWQVIQLLFSSQRLQSQNLVVARQKVLGSGFSVATIFTILAFCQRIRKERISKPLIGIERVYVSGSVLMYFVDKRLDVFEFFQFLMPFFHSSFKTRNLPVCASSLHSLLCNKIFFCMLLL